VAGARSKPAPSPYLKNRRRGWRQWLTTSGIIVAVFNDIGGKRIAAAVLAAAAYQCQYSTVILAYCGVANGIAAYQWPVSMSANALSAIANEGGISHRWRQRVYRGVAAFSRNGHIVAQ